MIALVMGIFAGASSTRLLDALLPEIAQDYRQSVAAAGMAVTAYGLSYSGCQLLFGHLGDRLGLLRLATIAAILAGIAALACALSSSLSGLIIARLVAGAVTAGIAPMALAWISHATSGEERPVAVANLTGASIVGATAGQVGGGLIGDWLGWQACFVIVGGLFLLAGGALARAVLRHPELAAIGRSAVSDAAGKPSGPIALLGWRPIRVALAAVWLEGFALFMSFTYIAVLLHERLGLGPAAAGLMIGCFGIGGMVFVLNARRIVARCEEAWRARLGGLLAGSDFLLLVLARAPLPAAAGLAILGFGFMMLHNIFQVRATHMALDAPGSVMSLFSAAFFLSQALGAAFGGWAITHLSVKTLCGLSAILLPALGLFIGRRSKRR